MTTTRVMAGDGFLLQGQANSDRWWTGLRDDSGDFRVITFDDRGTATAVAP